MKPRSRWHIVLAVFFALLALNAWAQAVLAAVGRSDDPPMLTALQAIVGIAAAVASRGTWIGARWAPAAAVVYGVITGGMIVALGPILDLDTAARRGLWGGAASVVAVGLVSGWWLRRTLRKPMQMARSPSSE